MATAKTVYICSQCGHQTPRWYGKCPGCDSWNTLEEELQKPIASGAKAKPTLQSGVAGQTLPLAQVRVDDTLRYATGMSELDRVLGGGLVKGSVVLLGGEPGIGKSTLMLQICDTLARQGEVLYISGEESPGQLRLRADRLKVQGENLVILSDTDCETIAATVHARKPAVVIVDSVQTLTLSGIPSAAGSLAQVRECTAALLQLAKSLQIPFFLVGHVNKEGAIAGPKVLEHIVDTVLRFEGDRHLPYRILRAVKNRFGSTNEIGVFSMEEQGLSAVQNPSAMLLQGRPERVSGSAIACVMEGSRPILAEVQALVAKTAYANPRRMSDGLEFNRLALLLAVLEKRGGFYMSGLDVYLNVVGGLRVDDPAVDLPALLALWSNLRDIALPQQMAAFGEVGLAGEIRSVPNARQRVEELKRLGFTHCLLPQACLASLQGFQGITLVGVNNLNQAFGMLSSKKTDHGRQASEPPAPHQI